MHLLLAAMGFGLVAAMTTDVSTLFSSRATPQEQADASNTTTQLGKITIEPTAGQCEHIIFDNQSGRVIEISRSCKKETVFDENGVPRPEGTIRRLDAISKSFQGSPN